MAMRLIILDSLDYRVALLIISKSYTLSTVVGYTSWKHHLYCLLLYILFSYYVILTPQSTMGYTSVASVFR